nr:RNA-directed DNA polymerase, eukaryota, reverse transcriptase zinc-binding domain protein [Tanacetum cinerariifolium]
MAPSIQSLSNASLLERLSCNIFITNFPTSVSAKDLWSTCKQFGTVMDVYIPLKLSKLGKRFAFARFKKGKISIIRAKEVTGWAPDFVNADPSSSKDESDKSIDLNQDWLNDKDAEVVEESLPHQLCFGSSETSLQSKSSIMAPSIQSLSNASLLERLSCNIFITNFPTSVSAKDLWSTCKQFGTVMDVYIPLKLSKLGKRFAFARFKKVCNVDLLIKNHRLVWLGSFYLFANVARFNRDDTSRPIPKSSTFLHPPEHTQNGSKKYFASFLKDPKEFESLPNIHIACSNEGFSGLKFSYLEGFWIMIEFVSSQSCMKFKSHEGINSCFSTLVKWDSNFEIKERVVWIDIEGIPFRAWSKANFEKIARIWGDPFGLDDLIFNQPKNKEGVLPDKAQSGASFPIGFTPLNSNHESPVMECASNIPSHIQGLKSADINSLGEGNRASKSVGNSNNGSPRVHSDSRETKMVNFSDYVIRNMWGTMSFDFASIPAQGRSGGDPFGLDDLIFNQPKNKEGVLPDKAQSGASFPLGNMWGTMSFDFASIPAQGRSGELSLKRVLWTFLTDTINHWRGEVVVMGDFNEVRYASDRFGFVFHASDAAKFNTFIGNSHLHDVPLGGYSYTWSDKHANKMSKLDRFLVSQGFLDLFLNISALILHRNVSDHRPILLKEFMADYGPTLFRLYHSWFLKEDFCVVLQETWNIEGQSSQNHMVRLKNKLKALKQRLKAWSSKKKQLINKDRLLIQKSLIDIDLHLDQGTGLPDDAMNRLKLARDLDTINKKEALDLAQKAKVRWAIEGDENSKYYHGIVNKKRRQLAIKGVLKEGDWIDNPTCVKTEFFHHFSYRFSLLDWPRIPLVDQFLSLLSLELANDMEVDVTSDEIKKAVWDCGPDKSPGPDGFTLDFFRMFWSIVREDVILAVKEFFLQDNVNALLLMLYCFFLASGFKINVHKSSLTGIGVPISTVNTMASMFGFIATNLPFTYLGVNVGANMKHVSSWNLVVNKVNAKLSTWKAKTLSVGGRLTLTKAVLGAIPSYFMSLYKTPEGVLSKLESMRNNFFLGANVGDKKITWVSWRQVMADKKRGGLASPDRWSWSLCGNGIFSVKSTKEFIDHHMLVSSSPTRWSKVIPIKLNIFV